jgi:GT2 family glycosyltransferase
MSHRVAICITTHNRRAELDRTLAQVAQLDPPPEEILVAADGCTDGTADHVRENRPNVRLIVHERGLGSVASRNEMARATESEILLSLDDDSHPIEADAVARIRSLFEENPRLAVAVFPQRTDEFPESLARTDFGAAHFLGSYPSSSAALRRSTFIELGGFFEPFFHMYEEPDYALRCVCAGWQVRFEPCVTVRHHWTGAQRDERRNHRRHARNELWSVLLRCPMPWLPVVALFRIIRQFGYACSRGLAWIPGEPAWWWQCLRGLPECLAGRKPLPWARYRAWMRLVRTPHGDLARWNSDFATP